MPSTLPPGLSINASTGEITGTPTTPGTYNVEISVTDGTTTATLAFDMVIAPAPVGFAITTDGGSIPDGQVDAQYNASLNAVGGAGGYVWSVDANLPDGLTLTTDENGVGQIDGKPTAAGSYTPTFTVTDSLGAQLTLSVNITITGSPVTPPPPTSNAPDNRAQHFNDSGASDQASPYDPLQAAPEGIEDDAKLAALQATGVVQGMRVTQHQPSGGMLVDVAAGVSQVQSSPISGAGVVVAIPAADATFPRRDSIRVRDGAAVCISGQAGPIPVSKPLRRDSKGNVNEVLLATVLTPPGVTDIIDAHITQQGCPPAVGSTGPTTPDIGEARSVDYEPVVNTDGDRMASYNGNGWTSMDSITDWDHPVETGVVYVCWIDNNRHSHFAMRAPSLPNWLDCDWVAAGMLDESSLDIHDNTRMAIDDAGFIHASGNMHGNPLHYWRSHYSMWDDAVSWGARVNTWDRLDHMTGTGEVEVTYPAWMNHPNGRLIFSHRDGSSGDGNQVIKRYDSATKAWQDVMCPGLHTDGSAWAANNIAIDGKTDNFSPYLQRLEIDSDGDLHLGMTWRRTGNADTTVGFYFFKIQHVGDWGTAATATDSHGNAIVFPIAADQYALSNSGTGGTPAYPSSHSAQHVALMPAQASGDKSGPWPINSSGGAIDANGYSHYSVMAIDDQGCTQHFHVWQDASEGHAAPALVDGWHCDQVTNFHASASWDGSTPAGSQSRQQIVCTPDGATYMIGWWPLDNGLRGHCWCRDLTPGRNQRAFPLNDFDDVGEFNHDASAARRGLLRVLIVSNQRYYKDPGDADTDQLPGIGGRLGAPLRMPRAICGLFTADLNQVDKFKNTEVRLPGIRTILTDSGGGGAISINHGPSGDMGGTFLGNYLQAHNDGSGRNCNCMIGYNLAGAQLFARMTIEQDVKSGSGWFATAMCARRDQILHLDNSKTTRVVDSFIGAIAKRDQDPDVGVQQTSWIALGGNETVNGQVLDVWNPPNGAAMGRLLVCAWAGAGSAVGEIGIVTIEIGVVEY